MAVVVAYVLYHKDVKLKDAPLWVRRLLFFLRAAGVFILLLLLLSPFLEIRKNKIEKPTVLVLHDNSASIVLQKDSSFYRTKYLSDYKNFLENLSEDFSVEEYLYSDVLVADSSLNFQGKETNMSSALQELASQYYNQNVGALILASDGIYNSGENPKYAIQNFPSQMPIYTVALGDTVQGRDNLISSVLHNKIAFRETPFIVKISVESHALKGTNSKIIVKEGDTKIFETSLFSNDEQVYKTFDCKLQSKETGEKIYTVEIECHEGEVNVVNNRYSFAVDVLESRQKIVLLYDAVHPDIAAVRRAIESNKNYECSVISLADEEVPDLRSCNCVVLCGLPSSQGKGKKIVDEISKSGIPCLLLYNSTSPVEMLNYMNCGVELMNFRKSYDEVKPKINSDFSLFSVDESTKSLLEVVPPLISPFGTYKISEQSKIFASQMVGNIEVDRPLIAFSTMQNSKIGFVLGEGLWRWRMMDFKQNGSFAAFDSFINKIVAYLALTEKRELFAVNGEQIFYDNKNVNFTAELYDKSFEPMPDQEITMIITNEKGVEYPYSFSSAEKFYTLNAGKYPQGKYHYQASVTLDGKELKKSGNFHVLELLTEYKQICADHELLRSLSESTDGKLFYPNEFDDLLQEIRRNRNIVAVSHTTKNRSLMIDLPFVLILILSIVSIEWFLRKYYATY
ncbi:MAG: hypothetical protein MJ198_01425 [Bacteroidales bacterium]|nr:hypothetical protein [Bacteroidales bacterium]